MGVRPRRNRTVAVKPRRGDQARRPPKGLCSGLEGKIKIENHSFGRNVKSKPKRMSALRQSFAVPEGIGSERNLKERVARDIAGLCTGIVPAYAEGVVKWAVDTRGAYAFDTLTSVRVGSKVVGFITLTDSRARQRSTHVLLLCARSGCGGYVYDVSQAKAISRGFNHINLHSVIPQYGFYRKKGFRCVHPDNRRLDAFWDEIVKIPLMGGDAERNAILKQRMKLRRYSGIHDKVRKMVRKMYSKNTSHFVSATILTNIPRGHLLNIVILVFNGSVDAFLECFDSVALNSDYTIDMEKHLPV